MAIAVLFLYLGMVYLRPGETVPALRGLPVAVVTSAVAALVAFVAAMSRGRSAFTFGADHYAYLLLFIALLSTIAQGWLGGTAVVLTELGPSLIAYTLLRVAVDSESRLRRVAVALVVLTTFLALSGIVQYVSGTGFGDVQALAHKNIEDPESETETQVEVRIRGTGIFNDPNDLAMVLVMVIPLALVAARDSSRSLGGRTLLWLMFALNLVALVLTRSRGGLLGAGVAVLVLIAHRFGRTAAMAVALIAALGFLSIASGRLGAVSAEEESAQGRIEAWAAGLEMVKSSPVLGVGYGAFTDHHPLVAHNSFVHVLAELGIFGAFCFTGLVYSYFRGFNKYLSLSPGWATAWIAAGAGTLTCATFLSRQYMPPLFVLFAVGAAANELHGGLPWRFHSIAVGLLMCAGVVSVYVAVRLLGAWG